MVQAFSCSKIDVLSELVSFFEIAGFLVDRTVIGDDDGIRVTDRRVGGYNFVFSGKVSDDGKSFIISEFSIDTPVLRMVQGDDLLISPIDSATGNDYAQHTFYGKNEISFPLDEQFLNAIVEQPVRLIVTKVLSNVRALSVEFLKELETKVGNYGELADVKMKFVIDYFAKKFSRSQ